MVGDGERTKKWLVQCLRGKVGQKERNQESEHNKRRKSLEDQSEPSDAEKVTLVHQRNKSCTCCQTRKDSAGNPAGCAKEKLMCSCFHL